MVVDGRKDELSLRIEWFHLNKVYVEQAEGIRDRRPHHPKKRPGLLDFTASVRKGITALLGPAGAGKSTLLRITAVASVPDDGRVTYQTEDKERYVWSKGVAAMGGSPSMDILRSRIGYVPQQKRSNQDISMEEALSYLAQSYRIVQPRKYSAEMIARWGLAGFRKEPLCELPESVMSRYFLVRSLIMDPDIWLLDEPTKGLDSWGLHLLGEELNRRRSRSIILIATNDLKLAEVADDLLLMDQGGCRRFGKRKYITAGVPEGTVASWYKVMHTFSRQRRFR